MTHFGETEHVAVTILVDNRADLIASSTERAKRFTDDPLLAEHGFSALIHLQDAGIRILWDAGVTAIALLENMRRMEIDPKRIDLIALSHGHFDHSAALTEVLKAMDLLPKRRKWPPDASADEKREWTTGRRIPIVAHPAAFRELWSRAKDGSWYGPNRSPPHAEWEAAGAHIVLAEMPYQLAPGCWTTGSVPRLSFEKSGVPSSLFYRDGDKFVRHQIEDDQAIVIHIKDKGLVVLSGCAHSGIVNTVNYAREISGVERVCAVLGGFHLAKSTDEEIQSTIDALSQLKPELVVPSHCTGFRAIHRFAEHMPEAFVLGLVGTTYLF